MSKLDELMKDINKEEGEDIATLGVPKYDYDKVPFSSLRMNYCTFGGLPLGKMVEFFGPEHGGKTTTAMDIIANFQKKYPDKRIVVADIENTFDRVWASKIGVNIEDILFLSTTTQSAEKILQYILDVIDTGEVGLVVLDSIGALVSKQAMEKSLVEKTYCGVSGAMTNFAPKAEGLCKKNNCLLIGINQVRDDLDNMYNQYRTPGGKEWKHLCIARFEFSKGKFIDNTGAELTNGCENPAGNIVMMKMIKNKTCPPTRRLGSYYINYLKGIDPVLDVYDLGIKYEALVKRGARYDIVDLDTGEMIVEGINGKANLFTYLRENKDTYNKLTDQLLKKMNEDGNI